jgi:putative ABC transport system substrate-binding protein
MELVSGQSQGRAGNEVSRCAVRPAATIGEESWRAAAVVLLAAICSAGVSRHVDGVECGWIAVMDRRGFARILLGTIGAGPAIIRAQIPPGPRRIGYLSATTRAADQASTTALIDGLRERGWIEGVSMRVEYRWSGGDIRRLRELAHDLLRNNVEVIVAAGTSAAIAARQSTRTVPIVFGMISDPVGSGVVASLARPGGNATGWANMLRTISGKLVELLREAFPGARRVAILWNPENAAKRLEFEESAAAAKGLGMHVRSVEVRTPHELSEGFEAILRDRPDALLVFIDSTTLSRKAAIVAFAAMHRLPAIYHWRDFVLAGGLMSYGPNAEHEWRQAARFVDRILRGAKPAEMPVEQPTKFELAIHLATARTLGITIPQSLLLRADEVIR